MRRLQDGYMNDLYTLILSNIDSLLVRVSCRLVLRNLRFGVKMRLSYR